MKTLTLLMVAALTASVVANDIEPKTFTHQLVIGPGARLIGNGQYVTNVNPKASSTVTNMTFVTGAGVAFGSIDQFAGVTLSDTNGNAKFLFDGFASSLSLLDKTATSRLSIDANNTFALHSPTVTGTLLAADFHGNGANITNINAANITGNLSVDTLTATTLVTGNVQRSTNSVASVTAINLTYGFAYTNHTANFTITGFTAGSYNGTNMQIANRLYTNDSVGAKTITLPASWIDLGSVGNPVYNTNIGQLGIQVVPGFVTNYVWAGK